MPLPARVHRVQRAHAESAAADGARRPVELALQHVEEVLPIARLSEKIERRRLVEGVLHRAPSVGLRGGSSGGKLEVRADQRAGLRGALRPRRGRSAEAVPDARQEAPEGRDVGGGHGNPIWPSRTR